MITAQDVVTRVRGQLIDPDGVRWTDAELLRWVADALRTVLAAKPAAMSTVAVVPLVAGTKQVLPADAHMLLGIVRNMGSDGVTPGRAVRPISRELIDAFNPDWHQATPAAAVQNYVFDANLLDTFYVYPPNNGAGRAEIIYAKAAPSEVGLSDELPILDNYLIALTDYVLFRAHQKDSDYAAGQATAQTYLNAFAQFLGVAAAGEASEDVNLNLRPGSKDDPA